MHKNHSNNSKRNREKRKGSDGQKSTRWFPNSIQKLSAEDALEAIREIDSSEVDVRRMVTDFFNKKMHVVLGFDDSLKGCIKCLSIHCRIVELSTLYRYLQAYDVEKSLELEIGAYRLTLLLKLYKYSNEDRVTIWHELEKCDSKSVKDLERVLALLEAKSQIDCRSTRKSTASFSIERVVQSLRGASMEELSEIQTFIEDRLEDWEVCDED